MAEKFEIVGGKKLSGIIEVRGSKNATTPILAATLLTKEECVISNVPLIEDVFRMVEILQSMGAVVQWISKRKLSVKCENIDPAKMDAEKVKKLRSSVLLLGSLSARFNNFKLYNPGGCIIGARPLGTHFDALRKMGVEITQDEKNYNINITERKATKIILKEMSVTATENVMMLAARIPGKTILRCSATEPHVVDLGRFLVKMGAKIKGLGTHSMEISGLADLHGAKHKVISDANEAATFLILGVATKSPIIIKNAHEDHLDLVLEKLREFGADFKISKNSIEVVPAENIKAVAKLDARTYPGIPSDIQAPLGVLATQAEGDTYIFDTIFEGRFGYIEELKKMGANAEILNRREVIIHGPTKLTGTEITSFDLRAGVSLIIAALLAEGKSTINEIYQVDRGYEKIEKRLKKLGADIKRVKDKSEALTPKAKPSDATETSDVSAEKKNTSASKVSQQITDLSNDLEKMKEISPPKVPDADSKTPEPIVINSANSNEEILTSDKKNSSPFLDE